MTVAVRGTPRAARPRRSRRLAAVSGRPDTDELPVGDGVVPVARLAGAGSLRCPRRAPRARASRERLERRRTERREERQRTQQRDLDDRQPSLARRARATDDRYGRDERQDAADGRRPRLERRRRRTSTGASTAPAARPVIEIASSAPNMPASSSGRGDALQQRPPATSSDGASGAGEPEQQEGRARGRPHAERDERSAPDRAAGEERRHEPSPSDERDRDGDACDSARAERGVEITGTGASEVEDGDGEHDEEDVERTDHDVLRAEHTDEDPRPPARARGCASPPLEPASRASGCRPGEARDEQRADRAPARPSPQRRRRRRARRAAPRRAPAHRAR